MMGVNNIDARYRKALDSLYNSADKKTIGFILKNKDVPFEYCARALKEKKLSADDKIAIVLRNDCTDECLVDICRKAGSRMAYFISRKSFISDDVIHLLAKRKSCFEEIVKYRHLSDKIIDEFMDKMIKFEDGEAVECTVTPNTLYNFINARTTLPMKHIDAIRTVSRIGIEKLKRYYRPSYDTAIYQEIISMADAMAVPADDARLEKIIDDLCQEAERWMSKSDCISKFIKIAHNPSISDYIVMILKVKASAITDFNLDSILDANEEERNSYRSKNKHA